MSGHSKWSQIKHKKGAADKKKGQLFSKLARSITIAARDGTDPGSNFKLRLAIEQARAAAMPKENIERAIEKAAGTEGQALEHATYEGFGPFATAFIVEVATDSRNRTSSEIRHLFEKHAGSLGQPNSVAWNFENKGLLLVEKSGKTDSELELAAIEAGAEDVKISPEWLEVSTTPLDLHSVKTKLETEGLKVVSAELIREAKSLVKLDDKQKQQVQTLVDALNEHDDVIAVYTSAEL